MILIKSLFFPNQKRKSSWIFQEISTSPAINLSREIDKRLYTNAYSPSYLASRFLPHIIEENHIIDTTGIDKIFASIWLSPIQIMFSTKCGNVFVYDTITGKSTKIPALNVTQKECGTNLKGASGIHAIHMNSSKTLVAVGAPSSKDFIIYSLPDLRPISHVNAHDDWIFGLQWLNDRILSSCSRDTSIKLWSVSPNGVENMGESLKHVKKVRNIKFDQNINRLASISADETFKVWDVNQLVDISSIDLPYPDDAVCLDCISTGNLFAIGSQSHVTLMDVRTNYPVFTFNCVDGGFGVRSLLFIDSKIYLGTGLGKFCIFDLKSQSFTGPPYSISEGYKDENCVFPRDIFRMGQPKPAIFTISKALDEPKLFLGGGPLHVSSKGSYAGIWQ